MDAPQERGPGHFHAVDITSLARQLREELAASTAAAVKLTGGWPIIIDEVGSLTRNVDPAEYDPHHVSIGPYHRFTNPDLARDGDKIRKLGTVLSAASAGVTLEVYLDELARLEGQARSCYAHSFGMESNEFVRMLLLDGCYLLAWFGHLDSWRCVNGAPSANGHAVQGRHNHGVVPLASGQGGGDKLETVAVVRDVFYLAENQIPFFVVDKIHQTIVSDGVSMAETIAGYVQDLLRRKQYSIVTPPLSKPGNLLHLLHMHLKPNAVPLLSPTGSKLTGGKRVDRWRTATDYYFAGVKFKCRSLGPDDEARCILDVKLSSGGCVLEVPRLNIDAETWPLLRNLMAMEQRNPKAAGSHVTAYCVFMSQLACTGVDVELLSRRGVIAHGLGNHGEVARCFADLCKGVVFGVNDPGCNYLKATCQALEQRCRSRPRRWMAWLRHKYFGNPWLALGLAAAAVGLACTVLQAVYAVLSYRQGAR